MKANCASQPVCSYTPITIIRRISWGGLSVHKIHFYYHIFVRIFFSSIIDASIKLVRSFPWEWNKKNKTKQNKHTNEETLNLWIDLENWELLEAQWNLAFYVTLWHYSPNVLKNIFMMLLSYTHSIDYNYEAIEVNVMEICVVKSLFLIYWWRPIES